MTPRDALAAAICDNEAANHASGHRWADFTAGGLDVSPFLTESDQLSVELAAKGYTLLPTAELARLHRIEAAFRLTCDCGGPDQGTWVAAEPSGHADWCVIVKALGGQAVVRAALTPSEDAS